MHLLTGAILAYNCGARLHSLVAAMREYCDEVIIGVDVASDRLTMSLAGQLADVIEVFPHSEDFDRTRLDLIRLATGTFVLLLDDDERLGGNHRTFRQMLLAATGIAGFWLSRQWVASLNPLSYFCESPWYPDWQLRLVRNAPRHITYPGGLHASLHVEGVTQSIEDWPIWHYERVIRTDLERVAKFSRYAAAGGWSPTIELFYQGEGSTKPLSPEAYPEYPLLNRGTHG